MGSFFFLENGKKVWTGPKIQIFFFVGLSWRKCYDFSFIHQTSSSPSTFITQSIVIACPQQAWNNDMELQNTYRNLSSKK